MRSKPILSQRFETGETTLLMVVLRHLGLSRMLAGWLFDTLSMGGIAPAEDRRRIALHAKKLEEKADRLTLSARELAVRLHDSGKLRRLVDAVEDALDTLDECAFLLSLVPETAAANLLTTPMAGLARLVVESVSYLVRAVEAAAQLPSGLRANATDSLRFIDVVLNVEHQADAAEREAMSACVAVASSDARSLVLGLELARALDQSPTIWRMPLFLSGIACWRNYPHDSFELRTHLHWA